MAKLIWTDKAVADLEHIYDFIAVDSPTYARAQVQKILRTAKRLSSFPQSGRVLPELPYYPHKELITGSYRIIHRYDSPSETVYIVTIIHAARLLTEDIIS